MHWGTRDGQGSEHALGGKGYEAEMHFVHYNTAKTIANAVATGDLLVIGVFLTKNRKSNEEVTKIINAIPNDFAPQDHVSVRNFRLGHLLKTNRASRFYTYP
jgi:carbonic anhydrase